MDIIGFLSRWVWTTTNKQTKKERTKQKFLGPFGLGYFVNSIDSMEVRTKLIRQSGVVEKH